MSRTLYRFLRLNHVLRWWLVKQLTPNGLVLLGCVGAAGVVGMDAGASLSYQVFAFLLALLVVAIATSCITALLTGRFTGRSKRHHLSAQRILPRFGTVGVPLQYRVLLRNPSKRRQRGLRLLEIFADGFPSFQDFQRISRLAQGRTPGRKSPMARRRAWRRLLARHRWAVCPAVDLPVLAAQGETEVRGEVVPLRRGLLRFEQLVIAAPDPLGLVNRCTTLALPQSVLILPKRYELPRLDLPGGRRYQSGGVALAASVGDSEEFRALREYRAGDSPRKIHWKSWAKLGKPVVKEEQDEYFVRHALILDTFQTEDDSESLEEAVAIAASLGCEVQTQESLLDMVFVAQEAHCFTLGRGLGQTERMLELLASVVPCQDQPFASLLPVVQARLGLLSGCICIFLDWDRDRQTLVEQLQASGVPLLVLVIEGEAGLTEPVDRSCLGDRHSQIHTLRLGKIQEGLWEL